MTNSMTEIPLSKAPRNFFDQDKWAEYVAHFDTEEIALMRLSSPPGIDFSWWKDPMKPDEAVRVRKEKIFKHKMDLIQTFYKRLENNSIIASGRSFNSPQRIPIPPERWRDLWPAFIRHRAIGCVYRKLNPNVLMMKSAQDGVRTYNAGSLNRTRDRRILVQ